jgi:hypothetical protein
MVQESILAGLWKAPFIYCCYIFFSGNQAGSDPQQGLIASIQLYVGDISGHYIFIYADTLYSGRQFSGAPYGIAAACHPQ